MDLDDELCLCFHVTKRKVLAYLRVERPSRPSQMSECYGAGTGCGWCRSFLERLFEQAQGTPPTSPGAAAEPTRADYARARAAYVRSGGGTPPPGATPIDEAP